MLGKPNTYLEKYIANILSISIITQKFYTFFTHCMEKPTKINPLLDISTPTTGIMRTIYIRFNESKTPTNVVNSAFVGVFHFFVNNNYLNCCAFQGYYSLENELLDSSVNY